MKAVCSFGTSGTHNPAIECNNPEDLNLQHQCCGKIKFKKFSKIVFKWLAIILKILEILNSDLSM
jgi:hypothetical protein